jgi:glutathione peroxidase
MTDLLTTPVTTLHDEPTTFAALTGGRTALVVNVASQCGLTPQYAGLEDLHRQLSDRAFTVVGFPCNQFGGQEPGTAEEIETFCSATYGVTFPMSAKIDVNGPDRDPVYDVLTAAPDDKGEAGDIQWNFEKFLVSPDGQVLRRFRPMVEPDAPELREAVEAALAG